VGIISTRDPIPTSSRFGGLSAVSDRKLTNACFTSKSNLPFPPQGVPNNDNVKGTLSIPLSHALIHPQIQVQPEFPVFERLVSEAPITPNIVPIFTTIPGYFLTPSSAYLKISAGSSKSFLFESVVGGEQIGRYSWIGANPFHIIESGPDRVITGDPLIELEKVLSTFKTVNVPGVPPFQGMCSR